MSKSIPLTNGLFAVVDDSDYERVAQCKWYFHAGYPSASIAGQRGERMFLHHYIFGDRAMRDHKDGDVLNNQRDNLRVCTDTQNACNKRLNSRNTCGAKGVSRSAHTKRKYRVQIGFNYQILYLGIFHTLDEAAHAYNKAAVANFGEFACLNPVGVNPRAESITDA